MSANADHDAIEIGSLYREARTDQANAARRLIDTGRRLNAKKASLKHGEWLPWLAHNAEILDFETPRTAQRLLQLGISKCDVNVAFTDEEAIEICRTIWGNNKHTAEDELLIEHGRHAVHDLKGLPSHVGCILTAFQLGEKVLTRAEYEPIKRAFLVLQELMETES